MRTAPEKAEIEEKEKIIAETLKKVSEAKKEESNLWLWVAKLDKRKRTLSSPNHHHVNCLGAIFWQPLFYFCVLAGLHGRYISS